MTKTLVRAAVALSAATCLASCGPERPPPDPADDGGGEIVPPDDGTGSCTYVDTPGWAEITRVEDAPADGNNCPNDPVQITFDYAPEDLELLGLASWNRTVTIGDGKNPPRAAVAACRLEVWASHTAVRRDRQSGSCAPVIVELTDLGGAECQAALATCFL